VRERTLDLSVDFDRRPRASRSYPGSTRVALPGCDFALDTPLGALLGRRASVRDFTAEPLTLEALGRLLHASAGIRGERQTEGHRSHERTYPSAGALYPLELYAAVQLVDGLEGSTTTTRAHELERRRDGTYQTAHTTRSSPR
jgi:hypothetical protein